MRAEMKREGCREETGTRTGKNQGREPMSANQQRDNLSFRTNAYGLTKDSRHEGMIKGR